jgi:hypothetical protein
MKKSSAVVSGALPPNPHQPLFYKKGAGHQKTLKKLNLKNEKGGWIDE